MGSIRFKVAGTTLSTSAVKSLRALTDLSIAELRRRSAAGEPVLEVRKFKGEWNASKRLLERVLALIDSGALPLTIHELITTADGELCEAEIPPQLLRNLFGLWQSIEQETQDDIDREVACDD